MSTTVAHVTKPTDFRCSGEPFETKVAYLLRECASNAENYHATEAFTVVLCLQNELFLTYMHTGRSFYNGPEILDVGCKPNVTASVGGALQGAGLTYSACNLHPEGDLLIASKCLDGTFSVGRGYGSAKDNLWRMPDVTTSMGPEIKKVLGPTAFGKYNVFYFFKMDVSRKKSHNYLQMPIFILSSFLNPCPVQHSLHFCERAIGLPEYQTGLNNQGQSLKPYLTLETLPTHSGSRTGSAYRRVITHEGYVERYQQDQGNFTMNCKPFTLDVKQSGGRIKRLYINQAIVNVGLFPGVKSSPKGRPTEYMANLRHGNKDGSFTKGGGAEFGEAPSSKAFLIVPWVSTEMQSDQNKNYQRFATNALATYKQPANLMAELKLPFQGGGNPFVTIYVVIKQIDKVETLDKDGRSQKVTSIEPAQVNSILQLFERRPDFMLGNLPAAHELMQEACKAAAGNVLNELRTECEKLFPHSESDFINLRVGSSKKRNQGKKQNRTREDNVEIFQKMPSGRIVEFDGLFKPGKTTSLALWHKVDEKFLTRNDLVILHETRGLHLADVGESLTVRGAAPFINFAISPLSRILKDGRSQKISAKEYEFGDDLPSRNIRLSYDIERINIGKVFGVPAQPRQKVPPPPGIRKIHGSRNGVHTVGGISNGDDGRGYHTRNDNEVYGTLIGQIYLLNPRNPFVLKTFKTDAREGTPQYTKRMEVYEMLSNIAKASGVAIVECEATSKLEVVDPYCDLADLIIDRVVKAAVASGSLCKQIEDIQRENVD